MKPAIAVALCVGVALLLVTSLFAPWWTVTVSHPAFLDGASGSAKPLDAHGVAYSSGVVASGVLLLLSTLAAVGSALLLGPAKAHPAAGASTIGLAALLGGLAAGIAPATWPPGDATFWSGGNSNGYTLDAWVNVGWYLAVASCLLALYSAIHIAVAARRAAAVHAASRGQTATSSIS